MLDEQSPLPLYYQLKEIFSRKIKSGEWAVGEKIPNEIELSAQYQVSRSTVRQALNELVHDHYIVRKQGKGTFVTAPKIEQRLSSFYSFSEDIRALGYSPSTEILDFRLIHAEPAVLMRLNLPSDSLVFCIQRLRLANKEPFALETSFIPHALFPYLSKDAVAKQGLYTAMGKNKPLKPDSAQESFEAMLIGNSEAKILHAALPSPGLYLERTTFSGDTVVEFCKTIIRGDRYKYHVSLR